MHKSTFRAERAHAALLQRKAELERQLAMKDQTKPNSFTVGFAFHFQGRERWRMEQEAAFIDSLLTIMAETDD